MDPASVIGVAAASQQFLKEGFKLIQLIRSIRDKAQGAPGEIEAWRKEIEDLSGLIEKVETSPALQHCDVAPTIESCRDICHGLVDTFSALDFAVSDSLAHKTWKAIKGLDKEQGIRTKFEELQRLKSTLAGKISVAQSWVSLTRRDSA